MMTKKVVIETKYCSSTKSHCARIRARAITPKYDKDIFIDYDHMKSLNENCLTAAEMVASVNGAKWVLHRYPISAGEIGRLFWLAVEKKK
jgi:hypothetical protein